VRIVLVLKPGEGGREGVYVYDHVDENRYSADRSLPSGLYPCPDSM
jgi:hypothetical protein